MAQGVALIAPLADHDVPTSPHVDPFKRWFTAAGVISDDFDPTALKSTHQLPHGAFISAWLAAMERQHDDKSQDIEHHQPLLNRLKVQTVCARDFFWRRA
jgi:hypothetical protein